MTSAGTANKYNSRGMYLGEMRFKMNMSTTQVAMKTGIKQSTYWNYECGKNIPSLPNAFKLAEFYGLPIEELAEKCEWV